MSDTDVQVKLHDTLKGGAAGAAPVCSQSTVGKEQPNTRPCALLPSSSQACTEYEVTPSFTSISKTQDSLKPTKVNAEPDGDGMDIKLSSVYFLHIDPIVNPFV